MRKPSRRQNPAFRGLESLESREMFSFGKLLPLAVMKAGPTPKPTTPVVNAPVAPAVTTLPAVRAYLNQFSQGRLATITNPSYKILGESRVGIVLLATIFWGDGTSSDALLTRTTVANQIAIGGGHTYQKPGTYTLRIQLSFTTDNPTLVHAPMIRPYVAFQAPVNVTFNSDTGVTIKSRSQTISGVLGTIANPGGFPTNPLAVSSLVKPGTTLTGTVSWGDGSTSPAQFRSNRAGGYDLLGSHTYAADGIYRLHIEIDSATGSSNSRINEVLSLAFVGKVPGNVPFLPLTYPATINDFILIDSRTLYTTAPVILNPIHLTLNPTPIILNGSNGSYYPGGAVTVSTGAVFTIDASHVINNYNGAGTIKLSPGNLNLNGNVYLGDYDRWYSHIGTGGTTLVGGTTSSGTVVLNNTGNAAGGIISISNPASPVTLTPGTINTVGGILNIGGHLVFNNGNVNTPALALALAFHADGSATGTYGIGTINISASSSAILIFNGTLTFDPDVSPATVQSTLAKLPASFAGTIKLHGTPDQYTMPALANATLVWLDANTSGGSTA